MSTFDAYVICTSPRSGSTLLCNLLATTGIAGNPESWFHQPSISSWLDQFGMTAEGSTSEREVLNKVFAMAVNRGGLDTGVFGLRLQRHSFEFFAQKLAVLQPELASDRERIHAAFGRTCFIHLTRSDKIEQAVSYVRADQTGLWHIAPDGTELERLSSPQLPTYDAARIAHHIDELTNNDHQWDEWFKSENIEPLRITYEALSDNPVMMLGRILDFLGLDSDIANSVVPGTGKLADSISREWVARFRAEPDTQYKQAYD